MGQKYFETKDGSLEAVSTKIAQEQPTIKKQEPNVKLERKTYFENKPGSLGDVAAKVVSENSGLVGVGGGRPTKGGPQMYAVTDTYHFSGKGKDDVDMSFRITAHVKAANINSAESAGEAAVKRSREYKEILAKVQKKGYDTTPSIDGGDVTKSSSSSEKVNVSRVSGTTVSNTPLSKREGMDPVNKDAVKKKFADRKDKDIDNDGDTDSTDKYLHKRRQAISKAVKEDLNKKDEPKVKEVIGMLKKASAAHAAQSKTLDKAVKNEQVRPDDKGEIINKKKHDAYGGSKGETKPVDPEPKISQVIKGEKETTRANGHMTKKKFSEMRIKLGKNGKTETGHDAPAVETEPKAERI